jgi:signal peptidase
MPSRKAVFSVLAIVLLVAVVIPFAVFIVPDVVGADQSYVVVSSSMSPGIAVGDAVLVDEVSPTAVEEGDVITFIDGDRATIRAGQAGGNLITHRVVDIKQTEQGPAFETKGDANEEADRGLVPTSALVGRVTFTIPYIGHVIAVAGTRLGFLALVAVPLGLLVLGELYDLAHAVRNDRNRAATAADGQRDD